jgi:hypothetical protein
VKFRATTSPAAAAMMNAGVGGGNFGLCPARHFSGAAFLLSGDWHQLGHFSIPALRSPEIKDAHL